LRRKIFEFGWAAIKFVVQILKSDLSMIWRNFADADGGGRTFKEIQVQFKKRYPPDVEGVDYRDNDYLAMDGRSHRMCKIACVAFCPLGERRMPDVVRQVKDFASIVSKVKLQHFPRGR